MNPFSRSSDHISNFKNPYHGFNLDEYHYQINNNAVQLSDTNFKNQNSAKRIKKHVSFGPDYVDCHPIVDITNTKTKMKRNVKKKILDIDYVDGPQTKKLRTNQIEYIHEYNQFWKPSLNQRTLETVEIPDIQVDDEIMNSGPMLTLLNQ
jgi:hypothetical protein